MANNYFKFKQFTVHQEKTAFKVGTDGVLLGACAELEGAGSILDVGTGTGLIAIMSAQRSGARITAIEPDPGSFLQAKENVEKCMWASRIDVINADFENFRKEYADSFDVIISNPPWFRDSLENPDVKKAMTRHVKALTPAQLLSGSECLLSEKGSLQVIFPYAEGSIFIAEASEYGLFCNRIIKVKPFPSAAVKRLILMFERMKKPVVERFITLETGIRHQYTDEYKELTRDFYLKF